MTDDTKTWTGTPRPEGAKSIKHMASPSPSTEASPLTPPAEPKPPKPPKTKKLRRRRNPLYKLLRALGWGFAGVLGLVLAGGAYLTGPLGERTLTSLTVNLTNKALTSSGLRLELAGITGLWDGELRIMGLKLFDKNGEWLDLAEGVAYPQWGSVVRNSLEGARTLQKLHLAQDPTGQGNVLVDLRRVTLFDLTFVRPPLLTPSDTPPPPTQPAPVRILPTWMELDIAELEVVRLAYGPEEKRIFANIYASARLSDAQGEVRLGAFLSPTIRILQGAPLPEALPGDVTLSRRELTASTATATAVAASDSGASNDNGTGSTPHIMSTDVGMAPPATPPAPSNAGADASGAAGSPSSPPAPGNAPASVAGPAVPHASQALGTSQVVFNLVWDGTFADVRWQARDTMLLNKLFPGVERLWSRARLQCNMTQWPPSPQYPLQIRMVSRFGLTVKELTERVHASLCAGQFFWDGQTLVARDLDLQLPLRDPHLTLQGSAGLSRASGPGMRLRMEVGNLSNLVKALGMAHLQESLGGSVLGRFAVGRGGRHTLWWTRPLPEPLGFAENPLPGFTAAPLPPELAQLEASGQLYDNAHISSSSDSFGDSLTSSFGDSAKNSSEKQTVTSSANPSVTQTVHDPRASRAATALHTRISLESDALKLPNGEVEGFSFVLRGTSLDADTAPEGTLHRKATQNAELHAPKGKKLQENGGNGTSALSSAPAAPPAPEGKDSDSNDFAASGLPRGMVGALELKARSIFAMGDANVHSQWMVGGLHGDADVLLIELSKLAGKLPGLALSGDVEMSYALPLRRPWPWLDGKLDVEVENWQALRRLIKSPVQGDGMGLSLRMESRFNEKNEPRQYLRADVKARQVNAPTFNVREVRGDVESDHAHALADLFSLAFSPAGRRKASPEGPPPLDYDLLKARLQLGAGSGGPVQWNSGLCTLTVAGEDARIDANLKGNVRGMLEGVFNFRTRLLQILKMEVSQGPENDEKGLRLRTPLVAALHENGGMKPVELTLRYGKGVEATARLSAQLQPMTQGAKNTASQPRTGKTGVKQGGKTEAGEATEGESDPGPEQGREQRRGQGRGANFAPPPPLAEGEEFVPVNRVLKAQALVWGLPGQNAPEPDSLSALKARVELPLRFSPLPAALPDAPLGAEIRWQGELEPLWKMLPLPGRSLTGTASISAGVGGTLARPQVQGAVMLRQGRFVDKLEGLRLQDITVDMEYGGKDLSRFLLNAADGRGGTVHLRGALLQDGPALLVNAAGSLNRLRPLHRDDLSLSLSGDLALRGPVLDVLPEALRRTPQQRTQGIQAKQTTQGTPDATMPDGDSIAALLTAPMPPHLLLSGRLRLDEGMFQLLQGFAPSIPNLEGVTQGSKPPSLTSEWLKEALGQNAKTTAAPAPVKAPAATAQAKAVGATVTKRTKKSAVPTTATAAATPTDGTTAAVTAIPQLQLTIDAPGRFFIRGKGLDSEWRAALRVEGSAKTPRLLGSFSPVRGTFELLNRQFRFDGGGIDFNGTWPPNPTLDISLAYKSAQITALVQVLGSARRPRLDLTSQPPLPRDEVMAQVLFGKNMESLSRFETLQAANAARQLVDMGPSALDVLSNARDVLGLQVLRLGSGTAQGTRSAPRDASVRGQTTEGQDLGTTLEAGKYITDNVYVGVEQGTKPEAGTAVRVEVELTPNVSLTGRTSQESSGVGLNWKMDY